MHRRRFLAAAGAMLLPSLVSGARAQSYPSRPVKIIVGFAPGGATDVVTRIAAQWLGDKLGYPFVVENRTGAGSNIAAQAAIAAAPDGYTLLASTGSNAVNATYYANLPFNILSDTVPIGGLVTYPLILVVHTGLPVRNVAEFIIYVKANPGGFNIASYGTGTTSHLTSELFKSMTGCAMTHIPYRGEAAALPDVIGGQVQAMFCTPAAGMPLIDTDKVRALGVTTVKRFESLPNIPTIAETIPGFEASSWIGLSAPKGTPAAIVQALNETMNAGLSDGAVRTRYFELGASPMLFSPREYGSFMNEEVQKWGEVVRRANIRAE